MKRFSKLLAVVLAIAVVICPMMSVVSHATTTGGYKIEAIDENNLKLTISSTDGFLVYLAEVEFSGSSAFQKTYDEDGYTDGLKVISYTLKDEAQSPQRAPRIAANRDLTSTSIRVIVLPTDDGSTDLYTEVVIGIRVASGATASLTKIQAADDGTEISDDPTLLTFPAAGSDGVIDTESEDYNPKNATTVHTHDLTLHPAVPATCTTAGNSAYYTCSGCDKIFSDSEGTHEIQDATIPATGHTPVTDEAVAPTCTEKGLTAGSHCSVCGAVITAQEEVPANGHTQDEPVIENNVPATCTTDGSYDTVVYCSVCDAEISRNHTVVPANGHTQDEPVIENNVPATCTTDGSYDTVVYCSVCGAEISRNHTVVPANGHTWGEYVSNNDATCTADGTKKRTCTVCGANETVTDTGSMLAHSYTYTPNNDGTHTVGCANCDYSAQETCDTAGTDGACSKCGYKAATGPVESVLDANINVLNPQIQIQTSIDIIIRATKATTSGVAGAPYASSAVVFTPQKFNNMLMKYYADPTPVSLESYTSKNNAAIYYNVASYEINLPISYYVACYDDLGNEVAHSNTFTVTPSELLKSKYKANPATAVDTAMNRLVTDTLNLGYAAQMYFAPQVNGGANDLGQSDPINMDWPQEYASESVGNLSDVTNFDWNASSSITDSTNPLRLTADISGAPVIKFSILRGSSAGSSPLDYSKLTLQASYTTLYTQSGSPEIRSDTVTGSDWLKYVDGKNLRYNFTKAAMYDANKTVTFVLTYDGVEVCTCTYSMDSYISNSSNSVASALGKFNASARAYFEAQGYTV